MTSATHDLAHVARGLVKAAHPGPSLAVTTLVTALGVTAGLGAADAAVLSLAVLTGQLSVGWANDLVDQDRDRAAGRADKPVALGLVAPAVVRRACAIALVATVALSFANGWRSAAVHLVLCVGSGWAYDLGLKATRWSWLPYAVAFGSFPAVATLALDNPAWPPPWGLLAGALLGVGAHFANALPDLDDDRAAGVLGLPQRLGADGSRVAAAVTLIGGTVALAVGPGFDVLGAVALAAAGVLALLAFGVRRPRESRTPFVLTVLLVLVDVALLLARGADLV